MNTGFLRIGHFFPNKCNAALPAKIDGKGELSWLLGVFDFGSFDSIFMLNILTLSQTICEWCPVRKRI